MYEMQYLVLGSQVLVNYIVVLFEEEDVWLDFSWGFDYGIWCVLLKVYLNVDIFVVQLFIDCI